MITKKHPNAIVIGNYALGDMVTCIGMVHYLATIYDIVMVVYQKLYEGQMHLLYSAKNVQLCLSPEGQNLHQLFASVQNVNIDVYAYGNFGVKELDVKTYMKTLTDGSTRKIISRYPMSYYEDVGIPFNYAWEYFSVTYPPEITLLYNEFFSLDIPYTLIHTECSIAHIDIFEMRHIDKNNELIIDINKNVYEIGHKYYDIAQKFINLPCITYYHKLLIYANNLYVMDSSLFALALITDVSRAKVRECFKRECRFTFYSHVWKYTQINFNQDDINIAGYASYT